MLFNRDALWLLLRSFDAFFNSRCSFAHPSALFWLFFVRIGICVVSSVARNNVDIFVWRLYWRLNWFCFSILRILFFVAACAKRLVLVCEWLYVLRNGFSVLLRSRLLVLRGISLLLGNRLKWSVHAGCQILVMVNIINGFHGCRHCLWQFCYFPSFLSITIHGVRYFFIFYIWSPEIWLHLNIDRSRLFFHWFNVRLCSGTTLSAAKHINWRNFICYFLKINFLA